MKTWLDFVHIFRDNGFHHDELKSLWWTLKEFDDAKLRNLANALLKLTET